MSSKSKSPTRLTPMLPHQGSLLGGGGPVGAAPQLSAAYNTGTLSDVVKDYRRGVRAGGSTNRSGVSLLSGLSGFSRGMRETQPIDPVQTRNLLGPANNKQTVVKHGTDGPGGPMEPSRQTLAGLYPEWGGASGSASRSGMGSVDDGRTYGLNHNTNPGGTWLMKGDDSFDAHVMDGR